MDEILSLIDCSPLSEESKTIINKQYEKESTRLNYIIKKEDMIFSIQEQVGIVSITYAFHCLLNIHNATIDSRLSLLLMDDVGIDMFKRRLDEIIQILISKGF